MVTKYSIYITSTSPPPETSQILTTTTQILPLRTATYILDSDATIVIGDFNAHHHKWYSLMSDHGGTFIAAKINNSDHLTLNTDTRHPTNRNQQSTSPKISTATDTIHNNTTWTTLDAINSDHKPIEIPDKTNTKFSA